MWKSLTKDKYLGDIKQFGLGWCVDFWCKGSDFILIGKFFCSQSDFILPLGHKIQRKNEKTGININNGASRQHRCHGLHLGYNLG